MGFPEADAAGEDAAILWAYAPETTLSIRTDAGDAAGYFSVQRDGERHRMLARRIAMRLRTVP